jgi:hypothetical protein
MQAAGSYCNLSINKGKAAYASFLPPALRMLSENSKRIGIPCFPVIITGEALLLLEKNPLKRIKQ